MSWQKSSEWGRGGRGGGQLDQQVHSNRRDRQHPEVGDDGRTEGEDGPQIREAQADLRNHAYSSRLRLGLGTILLSHREMTPDGANACVAGNRADEERSCPWLGTFYVKGILRM